MATTLRLHLFPPETEDGILPPTGSDDADAYAIESSFEQRFVRSPYASLQDERMELVSTIFEAREDNLAYIDEIETELKELYPEADILRTRDDAEYDEEGPEWEYYEDIILSVTNIGTDSPPIRWQLRDDFYGKQLTPPAGVTDSQIALTDGKELWGISTEDGEVSWAAELPNRTNRSPVLVDRTIVVEGKKEHRGFDIMSGEERWTIEEPPTGSTTRHISYGEYCYFGDYDGGIWELDADGDWRLICTLEERITAVCATEDCLYVLMREGGDVGTTPGLVCAIERGTGDEVWRYSPGKKLENRVAAGSDHLFVSTLQRNKMISLELGTGALAWTNPSDSDDSNDETETASSADPEEEELSEGGFSTDIDWRNVEPHSTDHSLTDSDSEQQISFSEQPIVDDDLFAPTNAGLLRVDSDSGEILWKTFTNDDGHPLSGLSFSVPTHDEDHIYISVGHMVYAVRKSDGTILWRFESSLRPGAITHCPDTESLTFIDRGSAINIAADTL